MSRSSRLLRPALVMSAAVVAAVTAAWPALAEPATSVNYPAWASATPYVGQAFDACTAPSLSAMQAWMASPYRAIGVYVGGQNRTCLQPELTSSWVRAVVNLGWRDNFDAPVATTAFSYQATALVRARSGPSPSYPLVKVYPHGASVSVMCQAPGSAIRTTKVWDKLNTGCYVTDYYISTPSNSGFSPPITSCLYPYQVTAANGVNDRSGPVSPTRSPACFLGAHWHGCSASRLVRPSAAAGSGTRSTPGTGSRITGSPRRARPVTASPRLGAQIRRPP